MKALVSILLLLLSTIVAAESTIPNEVPPGFVKFDIFPTVGSRTTPITIVVKGLRFGEQGLALLDKSAVVSTNTAAVQFLRDMYESVRTGDLEKYLSFWDSQGQESVRNVYKQYPDGWKRAIDLVSKAKEFRLVMLIEYGDYVAAGFANRDPDGKPYSEIATLKKQGGGYKRTNELASDEALNQIERIIYRQITGSKGKD